MKFKWRIPETNKSIDPAILSATGGRKMLANILSNRGYFNPERIKALIDPLLYHPAAPFEMPNMEKGVIRLEQAILNQEKILIWGDFDVDGQTSTALLYSALKNLGAQVDYHVPVREKESHGIKPDFLKPYLEEGIHILLSCDTGIAAHDAIHLANSYGVDVIVTDHHDCPAVLPPAYALINPKLFKEEHPLSSLPGVGVAYKLIEALYKRAGRQEDVQRYLDLVALGIVADLAIVTEDTRYLLQLGLIELRSTGREGLRQIMENAQVVPEHLIDEHIGFQIGPRLNAVGRLADANISIPLLTTVKKDLAKDIADELERLNEERKFQTEIVFESAIDQITKNPTLLQYAVLVLGHPTWHQGVIGIVASRLVERYGKPVILLSMPENKLARGSARSIEGFHITQAIATQEALLEGYGGHPMAAGLAIESEYIDRFRKGVAKAIIDQRTGEIPEPTLDIDAVVSLKDLTQHLVEELELLAPFGPGNPPINLLCKKLRITGHITIGKDKSHKKLVVIDDSSDEKREFLWWNSADLPLPDGLIDCVIRVRPGYFRGEKQLTITLQDIRSSGVRLEVPEILHRLSIFDYRGSQEDPALIQSIAQDHEAAQIWGEAGPNMLKAKNRLDLMPASSLVIWTAPPSQAVLNHVLSDVKPSNIYVIAQPVMTDQFEPFFKRFVGLIKHVLGQYEGKVKLSRLAAEMGHTKRTIEYALKVLIKLGIHVTINEKEEVQLKLGISSVDTEAEQGLKHLLNETRAYRYMFTFTTDLSQFLLDQASNTLKSVSRT